MLSRCYPDSSANSSDDHEFVNMIEDIHISPERIATIKSHTAEDPNLQQLMSVIKQGWPETSSDTPEGAKPYFSYRNELTVQDGLNFRGNRLVVPSSIRKDMKQRVHAGHMGINSSLRRARDLIFWPGMSAEIRQYVESCPVCISMPDKQAAEPLRVTEVPDLPWKHLGSDLFSFEGRDYLVTTDYYSGFFEIDYLREPTSQNVINCMSQHFARHGKPRTLRTDNGTQYTSKEFKKFAAEWGFQHDTSAPGNSKANGAAEAAVKIAKRLMKKSLKAHENPYKGLLNIRNTPTEGTDSSPAQRLMGRCMLGDIPMSKALLIPSGDHMKDRLALENKKACVAGRHVDRRVVARSLYKSGVGYFPRPALGCLEGPFLRDKASGQ